MKSIARMLGLSAMVFMVSACEQEREPSASDSGSNSSTTAVIEIGTNPVELSGISVDGLQLPDSTAFWREADGSISFQLPKGLYMVSGAPGAERVHDGGTITCTCTSGTGCCSPFVGPNGELGCSIGNCCTQCVGTRSGRYSITGASTSLVEFKEVKMINTRLGTRHLTAKEDPKNMEEFRSYLLEIPEVRKNLETFLLNMDPSYQKDYAELSEQEFNDKTTPIYISIAGYRAIYNMSNWSFLMGFDPNFPGFRIHEGGDIVCTCLQGSGCVVTRKYMGAIQYCDAGNCTSCQLSIP